MQESVLLVALMVVVSGGLVVLVNSGKGQEKRGSVYSKRVSSKAFRENQKVTTNQALQSLMQSKEYKKYLLDKNKGKYKPVVLTQKERI